MIFVVWGALWLGIVSMLVISLRNEIIAMPSGDVRALLELPAFSFQDEDSEYWVGDVTELYRMGRISKEIAEADTAPINPLIPAPRPFHGYFVRAMQSGPSPEVRDDIVSFKGKTRDTKTCAFCIFPEEPGNPARPVWIVCPWGRFRKPSAGNCLVIDWPKGIRDFSSGWAIVE